MMMKSHAALNRIASGFLIAFLLDGLISGAAEASSLLSWKIPGLEIVRGTVAIIVVLWAFVAFAAIFLTPRLKKRLLLPAVLFALWTSVVSMFPLSLLDFAYVGLIVAIAQVILALALLVARRRSDQPFVNNERPAFSLLNSAIGLGVSAIIAVLCVVSLVTSAAQAIDSHTGGYATLRPSGFYLEERTFRKEDKEVRLIGMVHIARAEFYDSIATDLRGTNSAVVLLEGVSDDKGLLKKRLSYNGVANFLGITSQEKSTFTTQAVSGIRSRGEHTHSPIEYLHADLDLSALQPKTIDLVDALGALLTSHSFGEALMLLQDKNSPLNDETAMRLAMVDLIQTRNSHLMATLQTALASTNLVIVPWGAMHLQDLQRDLEKLGFKEVGHKARLALSFF